MKEGQKKLLGGALDNILASRRHLELTTRAEGMADDELWLAASELAGMEASDESRDEYVAEWRRVVAAEVGRRGPDYHERAARMVAPRMPVGELERLSEGAKAMLQEPGLDAAGKHQMGSYIKVFGAELAKRALLR